MADQRKIIQLCVAPGYGESNPHVFAVCEDGTTWELTRCMKRQWIQLRPIPPASDRHD